MDGKFKYKPETDMSNRFVMYHVPYHDLSVNSKWPKDSGDMDDDTLRKCLNDIEIYRFEPPKWERRDKFYIPKSRIRSLKRTLRTV
jgi:hypothetical protein